MIEEYTGLPPIPRKLEDFCVILVFRVLYVNLAIIILDSHFESIVCDFSKS